MKENIKAFLIFIVALILLIVWLSFSLSVVFKKGFLREAGTICGRMYREFKSGVEDAL